ncbi:hypothetical protein FJY94_06085 [Candidatus Kaiserbacteria bacterium]|nr:hypothetical protein [Candidatus Kaiserbacteria bacterium]
MEHSTSLRKLPDGLAFPERLQNRISFDPARKRLSYCGFMPKCTYDELIGLASDLEYRQAVEQLFVLSSNEASNGSLPAVGLPKLAAIAVGALLVLAVATWIVVKGISSDEDGVDRNPQRNGSVQDTASTE